MFVSLMFLLGALALGWLWSRSGHRAAPVAVAGTGSVDVADTPAARELLGTWRDRARRWRQRVALPAVLASILASVLVFEEVSFGLVNTVNVLPLWADPLVVGLLALALGGFAAELHQLRPRLGERRSATLLPREVTAVRRRWSNARRAVLAVLLIATGGLHVLSAALRDVGTGVPWSLMVAAGLLVAGVGVERRIVHRPPPALRPDLQQADAAVRRIAARSVDDAAAGATLLLAGWAALGAAGRLPVGDVAVDWLVDSSIVLGLLAVLPAAAWWAWRSSPERLLAESVRGARP